MNRLPLTAPPLRGHWSLAESVDPPESKRIIECGGVRLSAGRSPLVMGILNVTPDSFSDGGRYYALDKAVRFAREMVDAGADIIDIGGESTRPGSTAITAGEELDRVLPVIDALAGAARGGGGIPAPLSIDTRKPEVADEAIRHGCSMINDIDAAADPEMVEVLHRSGDRIPVVLMHKRGDPKIMQENPAYDDVAGEVACYLRERAGELREQGIPPQRIIIDPGIGFGKRFRDNLELLNNIDSFRELGYALLIGASRKRFLGELLGAGVDGRLCGSLAVAAKCFYSRVEIVRVHDVRETVGLFRVLDAMSHPDEYDADW